MSGRTKAAVSCWHITQEAAAAGRIRVPDTEDSSRVTMVDIRYGKHNPVSASQKMEVPSGVGGAVVLSLHSNLRVLCIPVHYIFVFK